MSQTRIEDELDMRRVFAPKLIYSNLDKDGVLTFTTSVMITTYKVLVISENNDPQTIEFSVDKTTDVSINLTDKCFDGKFVLNPTVMVQILPVGGTTWNTWEDVDVSKYISTNQILPINGNGSVKNNIEHIPLWCYVRQGLNALLGNFKWLEKNSHDVKSRETTNKEGATKMKKNGEKRARKATTKTADSSKVNTATTTSMEVEPPPTFTDEAWDWMTDKDSIPGACGAPISYLGPVTAEAFVKMTSHSITLDEAKRLVQPDGPMCECTVRKGLKFQPVAYTPFCPGGLKKQIEDGATLLNAELRFGGQFYIRGKDALPVSGTVFTYIEENQSHEYAWASPLVVMAREFGKKEGQLRWGVTLGQIGRVFEKKNERNKMVEDARTLVDSIIKSQRRYNPSDRERPINPLAPALNGFKAKKKK